MSEIKTSLNASTAIRLHKGHRLRCANAECFEFVCINIGSMGFGFSPVTINQTIDPIRPFEGLDRHRKTAKVYALDYIAIASSD